MDKKEAEKYIAAGKILSEILKKAKKSVKEGQKLLEIAENMEKTVQGVVALEQGEKMKAQAAFPVNLSLNNDAAHCTPSAIDERALKADDVLKVDFGVQVDGFIADAAFTVNPSNKHAKMIEASEKALENALSIAKPGIELGKIGKEIQKTIEGKGFHPVQNLSGHALKQYSQHGSPSIPNIDNGDKRILEQGAFAIEPFATDGKGFVKESQQSEIFAIDEPKPVRNAHARKVLEFAVEKYKTLPFAERWIAKEVKMTGFQRKIALRELLRNKCIRAFPILREETGKIVTQAETSILVLEEEVKVIVENLPKTTD